MKKHAAFIALTFLCSLLFLQFTTTNFVSMVNTDDLQKTAVNSVWLALLPAIAPVLGLAFSKKYKKAAVVLGINAAAAAILIVIARLQFNSIINYRVYTLSAALICLLFLSESAAPLYIKATGHKACIITQLCLSALFLALYVLLDFAVETKQFGSDIRTASLIPLCLAALVLPVYFAIKSDWREAAKSFAFMIIPVLLYSFSVVLRGNGNLSVWNYSLIFVGGSVCLYLFLYADRTLLAPAKTLLAPAKAASK